MFSRSDEALCRALFDGDLAAFDTLYARYERSLFGFISRQLGDPSEAEDVMHEVFLSVLREKASARAARSFKAWVFQVARHLCLNRVRARGRAASAVEVESRVETAGAVGPEEVLQHRQTSDALSKAVGRLPPALSELYRLRASGLSYEELAEVLAVPLGTVKSRMHELVKRLQQEMTT